MIIPINTQTLHTANNSQSEQCWLTGRHKHW